MEGSKKVTLRATYVAGKPEQAQDFIAWTAPVASREDAEALLATFPKKLGGKVARYLGDTYRVEFRADLRSQKDNAVNETGVRRLVNIVATCEVEFDTEWGGWKVANAFASLADLLYVATAEVK